MSRLGGLLLVVVYIVYVAGLRSGASKGRLRSLARPVRSRQEEERAASGGGQRRVGRDFGLISAGVVAMSIGAIVLVEGIRHVASADSSQTTISLTLVGFATAFELVVLAVSASRRGATKVVVAAGGRFVCATASSAAALAAAHRHGLTGADRLHGPLVVMLVALALAVALGWRRGSIGRTGGLVLLGAHPLFVIGVW